MQPVLPNGKYRVVSRTENYRPGSNFSQWRYEVCPIEVDGKPVVAGSAYLWLTSLSEIHVGAQFDIEFHPGEVRHGPL